jgi:hypothetical protein
MSVLCDDTPRFGDMWYSLPWAERRHGLSRLILGPVQTALRMSLVAIPFIIILLLGSFIAMLDAVDGPRSRIARSIKERYGTHTTKH